MKAVHGDEEAFTGLEAGIIFMAFVVVVAVFSYMVLGAGFFTTQKSQQAAHAGVTQVASNIVQKGDVYLFYPDGVNQAIGFDIGLAAGGIPMDVDRLVITMSTPNSTPVQIAPDHIAGEVYPAPGYWSVYQQHPSAKTTNLLATGELFTIHVTPPAGMSLAPRSTFTIELKPETGVPLSIRRTIPPGVTNQTAILY
jgi:archaeal flagellin FlaB